MKDTNYAFCVGRIRALENKLLTKQDIATLINQKDCKSAFDFLASKGYSCESNVIDSVINNETEKLSLLLAESVPDKKELESLCTINDFFNIKAIVKCAVTSENPVEHFVYPTTICYEKTSSSERDKLFSYLSNNYRNIALEAYNYAVKSENGRYCDILIDKAAIKQLALLGKNKKGGLCAEIGSFLADTANIKIAFRCIHTNQNSDFISDSIGECCKLSRKKLIDCTISGVDNLISYLETTVYREGAEIYKSKPSDFEKWCDNEIISITKKAVFTSFGFDPIVSYYYRKNLEIKTVRMILTALKSDIDRNIIKERVRNIYV